MGCLQSLFLRIGLIIVWASTSLVDRAFSGGWLLPLLGLLFLPITTLSYVVVYALGNGVNGRAWLWVVLALLYDLGSNGTVIYSNRRRIRRPSSRAQYAD
jgi:hypothetical protein